MMGRPLAILAPGSWDWAATFSLDARPRSCAAVLVWSDADGLCSLFRPLESVSWDYRVQIAEIAVAEVRLADRSVELFPSTPDVTRDSLEHVWLDQILPGLLDHDGVLGLHAGAVVLGGRGVVFLGRSGLGKSTLTASLAGPDAPALNDDGILVRADGDGFALQPIYPGLRLLPDSLSALIGSEVPTSPVSHYATKRRVHRPGVLTAGPAPLGAVFVLEPSDGSDAVRIAPLPPARACMALVQQSFALDPTDTTRAAARLRQAAAVAARVPAFSLSYPRRFDRLPAVRAALESTLADLPVPA